MRERTVKETVTVNKTIYEAADGKTFQTKHECERYEAEWNVLQQQRQRIRLDNLNNEIPPVPNSDENSTYTWYKLENEIDKALFDKLYPGFDELKYKSYPMILCVEQGYYEEDVWVHGLDNMIKHFQYILDALGKQMEIREKI